MPTTDQIHIRDPFVLPVGQQYYLYGTTGADAWTSSASGFDTFTSTDLQSWDGPVPAFRPPAGFWADRNFWAPEVHLSRGRYVMFASFKADGVRRGTQILAADRPEGPFLPISDGPVTPREWECLDGTLFVDATDQPWIVFCHEWVQVGDGEICALRLSDDLTAAIGEPQLLFRGSEAPWTDELHSKGRRGYVTDGPWLHRLANGTLLMLWSSFTHGDYAVGIARSASGDILGPWQQQAEPLYAGDGGHCMTFRAFDGQWMLSYHRPNASPNERPFFVPLRETDSSLTLG
jgi:beta-xylosidase